MLCDLIYEIGFLSNSHFNRDEQNVKIGYFTKFQGKTQHNDECSGVIASEHSGNIYETDFTILSQTPGE